MRAAYYRAFKGTDSQHYFTLHSRGNGEPILRSEGYTTKASRDNGIDSVRRHSPFDSYYRKYGSGYGNYWFNLVAANNEVIGTSETYSTVQARETGIAAVKRDGATAQVVREEFA
ncbi:hypothetical protein LEM8419_03456 [Neolewinella maritima]|uniref:DUF1508 domain-containing protein n=1 Tax=Neolewinella maritima TaxID=1383882 RepID=A0ABM9B5T7_9BACT|nr:hypothetical protein LEM8419_03456 [Neolewinella maritima]